MAKKPTTKNEPATHAWQVSLRNNTSMVITAEEVALNPDGTLVFKSAGIITHVVNIDCYMTAVKN